MPGVSTIAAVASGIVLFVALALVMVLRRRAVAASR
jgi:hypothetical protein